VKTYSHSGAVPVIGALAAAVGGLVAAVVGGFVYAYAFCWIPFVYINFLIMAGFGAAVGYAVAAGSNWGNVRNSLFVSAAALVCMLAGIWIYWGAYMWALGGTEFGIMAWSPGGIRALAEHLFANGSWGLGKGQAVTGWLLVCFWVAEIAALLWVAVTVARFSTERPFCEACLVWTEEVKGMAKLTGTGSETEWTRVIEGDLPALAAFSAESVGSLPVRPPGRGPLRPLRQQPLSDDHRRSDHSR